MALDKHRMTCQTGGTPSDTEATVTQRMTDKCLEAKIDTVNRLLGHPEGAGYATEGLVVLHKAYSGTGLHRYTGGYGGVSDLTGLGTKRECALFLDGMIVALRDCKINSTLVPPYVPVTPDKG